MELDSRVNRAKRRREAFLTAFLNQLTEGIGERGKEAKEEAKLERIKAVASKKDFDARKAKINTLKNLTQKLITLGADKEELMFYIKDKNPIEALQSIYTEVSALVEKANKLPNFEITPSMISDMLNVPVDFKPPDMPMKEFWERTVNIFTEHEENFPSESTESFLGNLFYGAMNINAKARIMKELESQMYLGNKSIAEINEIAARDAFGDPFKGEFGTRAAFDPSKAPPVYSLLDVERFEEDYKTNIDSFFDTRPLRIEEKFGISRAKQGSTATEDKKLVKLANEIDMAIKSGKAVNDPEDLTGLGLTTFYPREIAEQYAIEKATELFREQKGLLDNKVFNQVRPQLPFIGQFTQKKPTS